MLRSTDRRRGISLVELLVVIGIIGILFGLLLSAVQAARHSAARTACISHLRQVGLAFTSHHDARNALPPAFASSLSPPEKYPFLAWGPRLLPYLGEEAAFKAFADIVAGRWKSGEMDGAEFSVFLCPMNPKPPPHPSGYRRGVSGYCAVLGTSHYRNDGCLYENSATTFSAIRDGTSQTLLVGERPPYLNGQAVGSFAGGNGFAYPPYVLLGVREDIDFVGKACILQPGFVRSTPDDPCARWHYWSFHPGGANFLFADGSVHFIRYNAKVLDALATRASGDIPMSW